MMLILLVILSVATTPGKTICQVIDEKEAEALAECKRKIDIPCCEKAVRETGRIQRQRYGCK